MPVQKIPKRTELLVGGDKPHRVTLTPATIVKTLLIIIGFFFLWFVRDIIGIVFVSLVFASALDPWVDKLERNHIPRWLSILCFYLGVLASVSFAVYAIIPPFTQQFSEIIKQLPQLAPQIDSAYQYITQQENASVLVEIQKGLSEISTSFSQITSELFSAAAGVVSGVAALFIVLVLTFYLTIEEDGIKKFIRSTAPIQYQPYLIQKVNRIQTKMGGWLRGQLIVMLLVGLLAFIGLSLLGVQYALVLAVLAALFELIPFIGPFMAAIPAVFFAYADSPWKAVTVGVIYLVIQQLENQVIMPKVMQKAVGLNPIVVIIAMLIGAKLAGVMGIILAVPATTIAWVFVEDFFTQKKKLDSALEGDMN